jgi:hypothetical protein
MRSWHRLDGTGIEQFRDEGNNRGVQTIVDRQD